MLVNLLGLGRVLLGLFILAWPRRAAQLFVVPGADATPDARFVTRLAGNRDLMLGVGLLAAPPAQKAAWLAICTAVDALDAAVAGLSGRGSLGRRAVLANVVAGGSAAAAGLLALQQVRASQETAA